MVKAIALQIQGKKASEIRETFGIDPSGIEELDDENAYLGCLVRQRNKCLSFMKYLLNSWI